jgi:hypothetical protein
LEPLARIEASGHFAFQDAISTCNLSMSRWQSSIAGGVAVNPKSIRAQANGDRLVRFSDIDDPKMYLESDVGLE